MNINKLVLIAVTLGIFSIVIFSLVLRDKADTTREVIVTIPSEVVGSNPKNLAYTIAGETVVLKGGQAEVVAAPGSASKTVTQYFGNELVLDINGDGLDDTVFLLTQDGGGSGTFFYLAAALKTKDGYEGSEAVFIGDRIAPQSTTRGSVPGTVVVNYADRAPGESFATPPSIGKSLVLKFDSATKQFGELVVDFEGEANTLVPIVPMPPVQVEDPAVLSGLTSKTWQWVSASYNDGKEVTPKRQEAFTLTFKTDGSFGITTDCNGGGGTYAVKGSELTLGEMMTTLMYCEGSQESEFHQLLTNTSGYHFSGAGELILDLKFDSGTVLFK